MPSIDELLQMPVEELEQLTDEQLLERYKEIFVLEPAVPLPEISDGDNEEDKDSSGEGTPKRTRTRKPRGSGDNKAKIAALKSTLMEASRQGLDKNATFDKLFDL